MMITNNQDFLHMNGLGAGVPLQRKFTTTGKNALDMVSYEKRNSVISEPNGKIVFEAKDLDIPTEWSQLATDTAASKYFRKAGVPGTGIEKGAKQMVFRVAHTIREFGEKNNYFANAA